MLPKLCFCCLRLRLLVQFAVSGQGTDVLFSISLKWSQRAEAVEPSSFHHISEEFSHPQPQCGFRSTLLLVRLDEVDGEGSLGNSLTLCPSGGGRAIWRSFERG